MTSILKLANREAIADLSLLLKRAAAIDDGLVRLQVSGSVLGVWIPILWPKGLMDRVPTVLGLRTFALAQGEGDFGVKASDLKLEDEGLLSFNKTADSTTASWLGITPPREGWQRIAELSSVTLEQEVRSGIAQVASAIPDAVGDHIVRKVRSEIWGAKSETNAAVPVGAAFGLFSLGFLSPLEPVELFQVGTWVRLSATRGHVLARS